MDSSDIGKRVLMKTGAKGTFENCNVIYGKARLISLPNENDYVMIKFADYRTLLIHKDKIKLMEE